MIRRAQNRDIPDVIRLLHQVLEVHHQGRPDLFKGNATKYSAEELEGIFADDRRPVFVCTDENDSRVLGYAFCIHQQVTDSPILTDIRTLYLDDLCVDEACRGQHIGQSLFEYVKAYAREAGCYNLTLNVWSRNAAALRFYEACGLTPQKIGMELLLQE